MADPTGKAARIARSKAACIGCRQTKQKCDGPSRIPCRRCELYNLECEYPSSTGPTASKPAAPRALTTGSIPSTHAHGNDAVSALMSENLREISSRLRSIESSLQNVHLSSSLEDPHHSPPAMPSLTHEDSSSSTHSLSFSQDAGHLSRPKSDNPVQTVSETVDAIDAIVKESERLSPAAKGGSYLDWLSGSGEKTNNSSRFYVGMVAPDVILRGIMNADECEAMFRVFFVKLAPWVPFFDLVRDRDHLAVRARNSLLFHSILLATSYYLMGTSERGAQVYCALTGLVNEIVAPQILSAQPNQISADFVRALVLLLLWKPVQFATLATVTAPHLAEQASKLNGFSSSILGGLIIRTAFSIGLPTITRTYATAFSPTIAIAPQIVSDLRLWLWLCVVDTHGALTTGRVGSVDIGEALRTTRMFASLLAQPGDARLAATVEVYGVAKAALNGLAAAGGMRRIAAHELRKFNTELDECGAYWEAPLRVAGARGDQLAWIVLATSIPFVRFVVNSTVFTRWRTECKATQENGEAVRPPLSTEDWAALQTAVDAAEILVFSLALESRSERGTGRAVQWAPREGGESRARLRLDPVVVDVHKTAFDTFTCVMYVFTLILLTKMANSGLIRCELICLPEEYVVGRHKLRPRSLVPGAKLGRLLELGADFLDAVAPTPTHPAKTHARMLRAILSAGTTGRVAADDGDDVDDSEWQAEREADESQPGLAAASLVHLATAASDVVPALGSSSSTTTATPTTSTPTTSTQQRLPPLAQSAMDPEFASSPFPAVSDAGSGEALASILGGISPSFFGDLGFFDSTDMGTGAASPMDSMVVDWESLEKSFKAGQEQAPTWGAQAMGGGEEYAQAYYASGR